MFLVGKVFDNSLNLRRIVDVYNSFIWNEYYIGYGDFQLRFPMDASALDYIKEGWYLSIDQSDKLMIIEKIGIETDTQNGNYAVIEGRSLESILLRRIIREDAILSGNFQTGIMRLIQSNMLTAASENRRVERITFTPSDDPRITGLTIDAEYSMGDNLYDAIVGMCECERVGFKIVPNFNDTSFEAMLYMGEDRSYKQSKLPWVVFSSKYENLKNSNMELDTRELKNTAIIVNSYTIQYQITNPDGSISTKNVDKTFTIEVNPENTDLDRREMFLSYNINPEEVDKSAFGKKEDRVNIRDYQTYQLLSFNSRLYAEDCAEVNQTYSSKLDRPTTEKIWVKTENTYYGGSSGTTQVTTTTTIDKDGLHRDVSVTTHPKTNSKQVSRPMGVAKKSISIQAVDTEKPDWLKTPADDGFKLVTVTESLDSWRDRNSRTFAAWEKALPDRRSYETWGWDFTNLQKRQEYYQALEVAQAEIDAEYEAALSNAEEKLKLQLKTLGLIELSQYSTVTNFEGEIDANVQFLYGQDYFMGDIVQIVNEYDFQATTRVVSMLFSEEEGEGFRALPSFESDDPSEVEL